MAPAGDIALWISQLADPDPEKRVAAAHAVRAAAFAECFSGSNDWIRDREFQKFTDPLAVGVAGDARRFAYIVGIAVRLENFERIRLANGSPRLADVPANQDAIEFELHFGAEGDLDILTTRDSRGSGAIARYLEKFGEGIQQVEVKVSDVDRATALLSTRFGLRPVYPATQAGADQTRVNFFLLPARGGRKCLIELVEPAAFK
jgi:hypothetical protein